MPTESPFNEGGSFFSKKFKKSIYIYSELLYLVIVNEKFTKEIRMTSTIKRTSFEQEIVANKVWWSPIFDGYLSWVEIATKKGWSLDQILAKATQEFLDRRHEDMFDVHLTVEEFREFATYWFNTLKERGWF